MTATPPLDLLSVTEVASLLSCSRDTVERIIDRGELPIVDIGHGRAKTRVRRSALEAWIASRERVLGRTA